MTKYRNEKTEKIVERNHIQSEKLHEPSFEMNIKKHDPEKWMSEVTKHPGYVRNYLFGKYGNRAFTLEGKIKMSCLNREIESAKKDGNTELEKKLVLAKTYKEEANKK